MIKILIPQSKGKVKTNCRGFWKSENSRVCYDYLSITELNWDLKQKNYFKRFLIYLARIKAVYNQEAVFYINDKIGYCYYSKDKIEILPHRIYKEVLKVNLKVTIKEALKVYGGLTIYQEAGRYYIEVFTSI